MPDTERTPMGSGIPREESEDSGDKQLALRRRSKHQAQVRHPEP